MARGKAKAKRRRATEVIKRSQVDPVVVAKARELARGNMRRVEFVSPTEAVVWNSDRH